MRPIQKLTIAEQTAAHIRNGILSGRWRGELPGVILLAKICDVSKDAMRAALQLLDAEGLISSGRAGGRRAVLQPATPPITTTPQRVLRIAILHHGPPSNEPQYLREILHSVQTELLTVNHILVRSVKSQTELAFDSAKIAKLIATTVADAWIVETAPREVLDVFLAQSTPAIALGGGCVGAPIASAYVDLAPGFVEATRKLIALGHRRIALISPRFWRLPCPGSVVKAFTAELEVNGIFPGSYHVPDHEPDSKGLNALFEALFSATPPTALLFETAEDAVPALAFLAKRGLAVPRDISLFCAFPDGPLLRCDPQMAHLAVNTDHIVRRIVRWVRSLSRGCADREAVAIPVTFVPGGTLAIPPGHIRRTPKA